jgi:hypothetical protein
MKAFLRSSNRKSRATLSLPIAAGKLRQKNPIIFRPYPPLLDWCEQGSLPIIAIHGDNLGQRIEAT